MADKNRNTSHTHTDIDIDNWMWNSNSNKCDTGKKTGKKNTSQMMKSDHFYDNDDDYVCVSVCVWCICQQQNEWMKEKIPAKHCHTTRIIIIIFSFGFFNFSFGQFKIPE